MKQIMAVVLVFMGLVLVGNCWGAIWYVKTDGSDANIGTSWATAYQTINQATGSALDGDEIWVKAGTYVLAETIQVGTTVGIYGGFAGTESSREERDVGSNPTNVDGDWAVGCFYLNGSGTTAVTIDGFTITHGIADSNGGGINSVYASLTASNCTFEQNHAPSGEGGAIYNYWDVTLDRCTFVQNTTTGSGGAVRVYWGGLNATNCTFIGNVAQNNGGAIYKDVGSNAAHPPLVLNNCLLYQNSAHGRGEPWRIADTRREEAPSSFRTVPSRATMPARKAREGHYMPPIQM